MLPTLTMCKNTKRNIPSLTLTSFKSQASAVGQKTRQRPTKIASLFYNQNRKTNKGENFTNKTWMSFEMLTQLGEVF